MWQKEERISIFKVFRIDRPLNPWHIFYFSETMGGEKGQIKGNKDATTKVWMKARHCFFGYVVSRPIIIPFVARFPPHGKKCRSRSETYTKRQRSSPEMVSSSDRMEHCYIQIRVDERAYLSSRPTNVGSLSSARETRSGCAHVWTLQRIKPARPSHSKQQETPSVSTNLLFFQPDRKEKGRRKKTTRHPIIVWIILVSPR